MFSILTHSPRIVCIIVLLSLGIGTQSQAAVAQPAGALPVLSSVVSNADVPSLVTVTGHGFTPGGLVYIAVYDQWGATLQETRWVTASQAVVQPPQSVAPGESFSFDTGGNISETFSVTGSVTGSVIQVPDGNQNPASGPVTSMPTNLPGTGCAAELMVRAHNLATTTWSAFLDASVVC